MIEEEKDVALGGALYEALRHADPQAFVTGIDDLERVVVDGQFVLVAVARAFLQAARQIRH